MLRNHQAVPKDFDRWLVQFRNVRNQIVHGHEASDNDALRAIDIGLRILPILERLARQEPGSGEEEGATPSPNRG